MMNEAPEVKAVKLLETFADTLIRLARKQNRDIGITDRDGDGVSFDLDGYPFTLSWGIVDRPSIGRTIPVVQFQLCIWHQTMGTRHSPPEAIDTTLIETQSIYDCVRVALETVAKDEIRILMENDGYEQMAKEEAALEQA